MFALQRSELWVLGSPRKSQRGCERSRTWGSAVLIPEEVGAGPRSWGMAGSPDGSGIPLFWEVGEAGSLEGRPLNGV